MTQLEGKEITKKIKGLAEEKGYYLNDKSMGRQIDSLHDGMKSRKLPKSATCSISSRRLIEKAVLIRNQLNPEKRVKLDELAQYCYGVQP